MKYNSGTRFMQMIFILWNKIQSLKFTRMWILDAQQPRQLSFLYARLVIPARAELSGVRYPIAHIRFYRVTSARAPLNLTKIGVKSARYARWDNRATASGHPAYGSSPTRLVPLGIVARSKEGRGWGTSNSPPSVSLLLCQRYNRVARNRTINTVAGIHVRQIYGCWAYAKSHLITRT